MKINTKILEDAIQTANADITTLNQQTELIQQDYIHAS